jgi:hypothetical protein
VSLGLGQILGVHRAQDLIAFNANVESVDETNEERFSTDLLIE